MSSREHECPRCGDRWHCDGCGSGEVEQLCGPCAEKPAPKPDELTVDDVLGIFPELGCGQWEEASPFVGDGKVRLVHPINTRDGTWLLHDDRDVVILARGTLREVLTEAKRRGLLG